MDLSPLLLLADGAPAGGGAHTWGIVALVVLAVFVLFAFLATKKKAGVLSPLDLDPLARLKAGLHKTRGGFLANVRSVFARHLDEGTIELLRDVLLAADMGPATTDQLISDLKQAYRDKKFAKQEEMVEFLKKDLATKLG